MKKFEIHYLKNNLDTVATTVLFEDEAVRLSLALKGGWYKLVTG